MAEDTPKQKCLETHNDRIGLWCESPVRFEPITNFSVSPIAIIPNPYGLIFSATYPDLEKPNNQTNFFVPFPSFFNKKEFLTYLGKQSNQIRGFPRAKHGKIDDDLWTSFIGSLVDRVNSEKREPWNMPTHTGLQDSVFKVGEIDQGTTSLLLH